MQSEIVVVVTIIIGVALFVMAMYHARRMDRKREAELARAEAGNAWDSPAKPEEKPAYLSSVKDVLAEADVYIAYGRQAQAKEILREGIAAHPGSAELKDRLAALEWVPPPKHVPPAPRRHERERVVHHHHHTTVVREESSISPLVAGAIGVALGSSMASAKTPQAGHPERADSRPVLLPDSATGAAMKRIPQRTLDAVGRPPLLKRVWRALNRGVLDKFMLRAAAVLVVVMVAAMLGWAPL